MLPCVMSNDFIMDMNQEECIICFRPLTNDYAIVDDESKMDKYHVFCMNDWIQRSEKPRKLIGEGYMKSFSIYNSNHYYLNTIPVGIDTSDDNDNDNNINGRTQTENSILVDTNIQPEQNHDIVTPDNCTCSSMKCFIFTIVISCVIVACIYGLFTHFLS
jgi:hypothetical protein